MPTIAETLDAITDEELALKLARVFYVVQFKEDEPYYYVHGLAPKNNFNIGHKDSDRLQLAEGLVEVGKIKTYHRYGYQAYFKPSLKEVLAQIPLDRIEREGIVAFEGGSWSMHEGYKEGKFVDSYHMMEVTLFRLEKGATRPDPNHRQIRKLIIEADIDPQWGITSEDSGAALTVDVSDHEEGQPIWVRLISSQYEDDEPDNPSQKWDDHKDLRDLISTGRVKITIETIEKKNDTPGTAETDP